MADDATESDKTLQDLVVEEIRVLLVRRGLSETALADLAGMKQAYLSRRMTGKLTFGLDDLEKIAAALEVEVFDLFPVETAEPAAVAPVEPRVLTRSTRGRRLTGSYPDPASGATPVRTSGHVAPARRPRLHSPERPPSRPTLPDDDRPVRLTRPTTPKRTARTPGDGVL